MSAATVDLLRRASALMRERADAASQGEWWAASDNKRKSGIALVGIKALRGQGETGCIAVLAGTPRAGTVAERHANAEHIASWHPDVARTVARVLEHEADIEDQYGASASTLAVAIAQVYLGEHTPLSSLPGRNHASAASTPGVGVAPSGPNTPAGQGTTPTATGGAA